jgi:hypothetical protein
LTQFDYTGQCFTSKSEKGATESSEVVNGSDLRSTTTFTEELSILNMDASAVILDLDDV